jgi:hypothetical protein
MPFTKKSTSSFRQAAARSFVGKGPSFAVDDPSSLKYWKRVNQSLISKDAPPVIREAKIISLSDMDDPANAALHKAKNLPEGAKLLAVGTKLEDFALDELRAQAPNVLFVSHPQARKPLGQLLKELPSIEWVHTRSAGIDFVTSRELAESPVVMTNARGSFSSTLAEYTMMACSFFAKVRVGGP